MQTIYVTAFIDWDTAKRCKPFEIKKLGSAERQLLALRNTIEDLKDKIAEVLYRLDSDSVHRVSLRFYHGWFKGKTKTDDRRALEKIKRSDLRSSIKNKITFPNEFSYCDYLLSDEDNLYPLYDTLRDDDTGKYRQKMIDTSITCDVLEFIRSNKNKQIAIVVGADDDLLPAIFTANTWKRKAYMLRINREQDNKHLKTSGLILRHQESVK